MTEKFGGFEDRVRFNWGYHDAHFEWEHYQGPAAIRLQRWGAEWQAHHHDRVYVAGYNAGFADSKAGTYANDSEPAWIASGLVETNG